MANDKNGVVVSYQISDSELQGLMKIAQEPGQPAVGQYGLPSGFAIAIRVGLQMAFDAGRQFERIKLRGEEQTQQRGGW
jgi:hypothetical protein